MIHALRSRLVPLLAAAGLAAASASCAETFLPRVQPGGVLFEVEYTNAAWGPQWSGFYVDDHDRVFSYDVGGADFQAMAGDEFTAAQLAAKYAHGAKLVTTLAPGEAATRYDAVAAVLPTALTAPRGACADAGTLRFTALTYDAAAGTYRRILLRQRGDVAQANLSPAATGLYHWLEGVTGLAGGSGCDPFDG